MALPKQFTSIVGDSEDEDTERIDIDQLDGEELTEAIEYLEAIGRSTTSQDIEEAAYYLRNVDDDVELYSAFETGTERGRLDRSIVAPQNMEPNPKFHTRDGDFYSVLTATSMPRLVTPGWLVPLTLSEYDVRISMQIKPRETASVKGRLQQRLTQMKSAIQWKQKRGRTDVYEEEHERRELERLLRSVIEGTTKLFEVGMYLEVHGSTLEEMQEASRSIKRSVSEQGMDLTEVETRQIESQQAVAPVGTDPIKNNNTVQLEALSTFFNFVEPPVYQPGGALMGFDDSKRPVVVDRFALSGHCKVVTGKKGGGKTYSVKITLWRRLLNNPTQRVIVFDPLGDDFVDFTNKVGGTVIKFGGDDRINPLEINPPTDREASEDLYTTSVRSVIEILKTYFEQPGRGGMDAGEEGITNQCIHYAYSKMGITTDPSTFDKQSPILDDLFEGVEVIAAGGLESDSSPVSIREAEENGMLSVCPERTREVLEDPSEQHIQIAQQLVPKFESFKAGSINNNLNGRTNIDLSDRVVCFNMESFADTGEMPLIMHTMLDWAYKEARRSPVKTDVTFEEVHYLLGRPGARKLLNLFIRHARHFESGLTLITQTPDEFLTNDSKKEIYDNCDIKQLFYQENVSKEVIEYFDFSEEEARYLRQAARGQNSDFSECLLSTSEHGRRRLEIYAGPFERHIVEEDLDPWGYLKQQGLLDDDSTMEAPDLHDAVERSRNSHTGKPRTAPPVEVSTTGESPQQKIDSPDELTMSTQTVSSEPNSEPTDNSDTESDDPYRVRQGGSSPVTQPVSQPTDTATQTESPRPPVETHHGPQTPSSGETETEYDDSSNDVEGGSSEKSPLESILAKFSRDSKSSPEPEPSNSTSDSERSDESPSRISNLGPGTRWALKMIPLLVLFIIILTVVMFQPSLIP